MWGQSLSMHSLRKRQSWDGVSELLWQIWTPLKVRDEIIYQEELSRRWDSEKRDILYPSLPKLLQDEINFISTITCPLMPSHIGDWLTSVRGFRYCNYFVHINFRICIEQFHTNYYPCMLCWNATCTASLWNMDAAELITSYFNPAQSNLTFHYLLVRKLT